MEFRKKKKTIYGVSKEYERIFYTFSSVERNMLILIQSVT